MLNYILLRLGQDPLDFVSKCLLQSGKFFEGGWMNLTLGQLKKMIENLNIPDDAEIWIEFPIVSGVKTSSSDTISHYESRVNLNGNREDWISSASICWSPAQNRLRITHSHDQ